MQKIVVIGSSNVDTTLHVENFPKPGETINAHKVSEAGGGKDRHLIGRGYGYRKWRRQGGQPGSRGC